MPADLSALQEQVRRNKEVEDSAATLIRGLADQLAAAKNDPQAVQDLADALRSSADNLAAAVAENTPAA
jgi:hypothetical protein